MATATSVRVREGKPLVTDGPFAETREQLGGYFLVEAKDLNDEWAQKVFELVKTLDTYIPLPVRETDKPFLMPIEDIFSIEGRGTVVTGRIERGKVPALRQLVGRRRLRRGAASSELSKLPRAALSRSRLSVMRSISLRGAWRISA